MLLINFDWPFESSVKKQFSVLYYLADSLINKPFRVMQATNSILVLWSCIFLWVTFVGCAVRIPISPRRRSWLASDGRFDWLQLKDFNSWANYSVGTKFIVIIASTAIIFLYFCCIFVVMANCTLQKSNLVVVLPPTIGPDMYKQYHNASPVNWWGVFSFLLAHKRLACKCKEAVGERFLCTKQVMS